MVFHIPRPLNIIRVGGIALKFRKHFHHGFVHNVGQNVQTATVGHAQNDLFRAQLGRGFQGPLQRRNDTFPAVQTKTLGARVFQVQVFFKPFGAG